MGKHSSKPNPPADGQSPQQKADAFDASVADSNAKTAERGSVPNLPPTDGKHGAGSATATNGSGNN